MNACELLVAITAAAISIAEQIPDDDLLNGVGAVFLQLGTSLQAMADIREAQKAACSPPPSCCCSEE